LQPNAENVLGQVKKNQFYIILNKLDIFIFPQAAQ